MKTVTEAAREIPVVREADVVVVGGGPGGVSAAVSAARSGANTVLVERYGHLGGMATGGLVNAIPNLATIEGEQTIAGIVQETIDRLARRDSVHIVDKTYWGKHHGPLVERYLDTGFSIFFLRKHPDTADFRLIYGALAEPEILKHEFNEMCLESGVDVFLHSWGTRPIMDGKAAKGVYFESKSGRQAILAKTVIDSTGDGDIFYEAGAEYEADIDSRHRHSNLSLSCWIAGVDMEKRNAFKHGNRERYYALMAEMRGESERVRNGLVEGMITVGVESGHMLDGYFEDILKNHGGIAIAQPHVHADDQTDVEEITRVNMQILKRHVEDLEYMRKNIPGFENSYIVQTAAQLGTMGGKRVKGEYRLTMDDLWANAAFGDTIAVFPNVETGASTVSNPVLNVPYRTMVPKGIEGMLVACRGFSSSDEVNQFWNLIPHCMCLGQAAGAAAAIAAREGVSVRDVDFAKLRGNLLSQNVILP